ncbi:hypothetical protein BGW36DRAFT_366738 [Talaromyces proteolyticus]|uniref:Tetratricopeptide repeat protein 36 n=1 Tax=Talaromyces proteolyticus TaxID=1131652 RepID=A0AAD4Q5W7_9EURO|nr:uncharacterized protein BGW36DRAFT_366738 [Talaromyces proteolyticus]KAH8705056.1 hypothetical protein BGW36DRAFT_366738 [Talaromyces proteolyticus]
MATATSISTPALNLSSNDTAVLQALFDAESSTTSSSSAKIISSLPPFPSFAEGPALEALKQRELAIIRRIQDQSAQPTPIENAITDLTALITESPTYPPLYANRAQAIRMLIQTSTAERSDDALFLPEHTSRATALFADLSQAITLSSPAQRHGSVSPAQARLLSNTYTHRGYLLLKAAKIRKEREEKQQTQRDDVNTDLSGPQQLLRIDTREQLEEMASQDFFQAGWYGNEVARQLSVQTNPYAKMCGAIVKEALRKEIEEFQ